MSGFPDYDNYDALGLAELVRTRQVTPAELLEEAIARADRLNPALNAIIYRMDEPARATAARPLPDGPFTGVPFLLKDLLSTVAGHPTSQGTKALRGVAWPNDSELVRRFKASGVVIFGKTNTPEFGLTPFTEPEAFGPTRNPWDVRRTAGGSSGGSAAAVAAGIVPIASGGDGGGSIRIPASCCGVFGLKPTRGRTPTGPDMGEVWSGFAIEHVVTRSVRDSAAMLDAISGAEVGAPYACPAQARPFLAEVTTPPGRLRIAFTTRPLWGGQAHPDNVAGLGATLRLLQSLGHDLVEAVPAIDGEAEAVAFMTIIAAETASEIQTVGRILGRKPTAADFEPSTWALGMLGRAMSAAAYASARRMLQLESREVARFFERFDVLLTPTLGTPPPLIGALQPTPAQRRALQAVGRTNAGALLNALGVIKPLAKQTFEFIPYTPLFNVTGQPAMSVPLHWNAEGLPIGMQFVGRFGDEATLFRLAGQLEQARPWENKRPEVGGRRSEVRGEAAPTAQPT